MVETSLVSLVWYAGGRCCIHRQEPGAGSLLMVRVVWFSESTVKWSLDGRRFSNLPSSSVSVMEIWAHRPGWGNIPTSQQYDDSSVDGDLFFGSRNHPNSMVRLLSRNNVLIAWRMILVPPTNLRGGALGALGALNIDSSSNRLLQVATATGSGWKQVGAPVFGLCTGRWWWWRWSESLYGGERVMFSTFFRMFLFFLSRWGMFGYTILVLLNLKDRMTLRKGSWLRLIRWNWMEKGSSFPGLQGWIHIGIKFGTLFLMFGCYLRGPAKWLWMAIFPMKHFTSATPINCIQEKRQIQ